MNIERLEDERPTSNVQHRTSNNDVALLSEIFIENEGLELSQFHFLLCAQGMK